VRGRTKNDLVNSPAPHSATWEAWPVPRRGPGWRVGDTDLSFLVEARHFKRADMCAAAAPASPPVRRSRGRPQRAGDQPDRHRRRARGRRGWTFVLMTPACPEPGTSGSGRCRRSAAAWLSQMAVSGRLPTWDTWFPAGLPSTTFMPDHDQRPRSGADRADGPSMQWQGRLRSACPYRRSVEKLDRRVYLQMSAAYQPKAAEEDEGWVGYMVTGGTPITWRCAHAARRGRGLLLSPVRA